MSMTSELGDPDIKIGGLDIWVHGRQFPDSQDYWDSSTLNITAEYKGRDSHVKAHGAFIHLHGLTKFFTALQTLDAELKGVAILDCRSPSLRVEVRAKSLGHLEIETSLTADYITESHVYTVPTDQTFLPPILAALKQVLERYPVREPNKRPS